MTAVPFVADQERIPGHTHVLLITTGSVASIKAPLIVKELLEVLSFGTVQEMWRLTPIIPQHANVKVEVIATKPSLTFYDINDIASLGSMVWQDVDEWPVCLVQLDLLLLRRLTFSLTGGL